ncbi:hypothetical protein Nepgr_010693 [Nepenthes gracilis]|uniref:Uncharacterized protein n=1 Tax=Nepenthes gracilis TaxID=150966 RepID=A0AAD3SCV4_NEPGR|nr:hypothetical protein Nepgr_010693 [Nepenthes gracilis]
MTPEENPEWRNPRYFRGENRNPEGASRTIRSIGDPRLEKIWNRMFKDDDHAIDLDKSPFTTEILSHLISAKFNMPSLTLMMGALIR